MRPEPEREAGAESGIAMDVAHIEDDGLAADTAERRQILRQGVHPEVREALPKVPFQRRGRRGHRAQQPQNKEEKSFPHRIDPAHKSKGGGKATGQPQ